MTDVSSAIARDPLRRGGHVLRLLVYSITVALGIAVAGIVAFPSAAAAAELGPGYQSPSHPLDHLGAYVAPDGTMTYCIDIGEPSTVGAVTTDAGTASQVNDLGPEEMLKLSFVLAQHGTTTDARTAAAVAMVVWGIAGGDGYRSVGGDAAVLSRAPQNERATIQGLVDRFRAEAAAFNPTAPSASMTVSIDEGDDYAGFLGVSVRPASSRGTVTLTNAVFADSGAPTRDDVADGDRLAITGVPPAAPPADASTSADDPSGTTESAPLAVTSSGASLAVELEPYRVSAASDDFTAPGEPSGIVRLFTTPRAQALVAASAVTPRVFSASASDTRDRDVPTLTTLAQATGLVGGAIRDSAIIAHVPSSGLQLSWSAYLQPPASGSSGMSGSNPPTCTPDTAVFETDVPLTVTADGTYPSADFTVADRHIGTIYWVATLAREGEVVAQGRCGDPTETTVVAPRQPRLPIVSG